MVRNGMLSNSTAAAMPSPVTGGVSADVAHLEKVGLLTTGEPLSRVDRRGGWFRPRSSDDAENRRLRKIGVLTLSSFAFALLAIGFNPGSAGATITFTCNGLIPTIVGQGGTINGTSGDDVIIGTAGNETINGGSGNDTICGMGGDDTLNGGSGDDDMWGEAFRPGVVDFLIGVPGNDILNGGSGDDLLVDPVGFGQVLNGGSGIDTILGFGEMLGGSGNDSIRVFGDNNAPSILNGNSGTDTCTPRVVGDVLISCEATS